MPAYAQIVLSLSAPPITTAKLRAQYPTQFHHYRYRSFLAIAHYGLFKILLALPAITPAKT